MENTNKTQMIKDLQQKKITVSRSFNAPREDVWSAWTQSELLDEWWAPHPWKTQTKYLNFVEGGQWLYAMLGPDDQNIWSISDYLKINLLDSFKSSVSFCDENGIRNPEMGTSTWNNKFIPANDGTNVTIEILFVSEKDLQNLINMGFEEGLSSALSNLDQYLEARHKLKNQLTPLIMPRVSTYLNFPGNTEDAFNFYKDVFGTEFNAPGIQRFGDYPQQEGQPPINDTVKKMILHIELPILNGHVLMGTDAPKEMGFNLNAGNNVHLMLEPQTKEETTRLFNALSEDGNVTMPLADMFWGAYYGSCSDKFGINWMFNFNNSSGQ